MSEARYSWRNVHLHEAATQNYIGEHVHQADEFFIRHRVSGTTATPSNNIVTPRDYEIVSQGKITVADAKWFYRLPSHPNSDHEDSFRDGVRNRDKKCVVSGRGGILAMSGVWISLEAAHVLPLELESELGYSGTSNINSVQNGLLLKRDLHVAFDQYLLSINPDDGYKIISFTSDEDEIDGRVLDPVCRDPANPDHVLDEFLRWHHRQSILANMRGGGEPIFEVEFPPGTDQMKALLSRHD